MEDYSSRMGAICPYYHKDYPAIFLYGFIEKIMNFWLEIKAWNMIVCVADIDGKHDIKIKLINNLIDKNEKYSSEDIDLLSMTGIL